MEHYSIRTRALHSMATSGCHEVIVCLLLWGDKTIPPVHGLIRRYRQEITMRNLLVVFASATAIVSSTLPSNSQAYLYGLPSNGVSGGPYGNSDYRQYRYNQGRESDGWRQQRNDWRDNSNGSVWRRDRNDWKDADDWRPRDRRD